MLKISNYIVSIMNTNCYLIKDTQSNYGVIVDPGKLDSKLDEDIKKCEKIEYILLTHGHFDHIYATSYYKNITDAKIVIGVKDAEFTQNNELNLSYRFKRTKIENFYADVLIDDKDKINFSNNDIEAIYTPGHTRGSVCYLIGNFLFTGDTLMNSSIGRSDLPTGNQDNLNLSVQKLLKMEGDYVVYPGHGPSTTINNERRKYLQS